MPLELEEVAAALADRFRVERQLGAGGWAVVFLAEDLKHRRKVAIKVLKPEIATRVGVRRFAREIEVAGQLVHPHILPLHDSSSVDGLSYYVMPYVEGESLRDRLRREGQLPIREAVRLAREVADALAHAHARGVVHRDIKPGNIMLEADHAMVSDFGIASVTESLVPERLTETGQVPGTLLYMSPEQVTGEGTVDGRSDIYSLGCVLYEMLVGEPPFRGPSAQALMARKLTGEVPSMRVVRESVPESLEGLAERALARLPADRFATAADLVEALEEIGPDVEAPSDRPRARRRRGRTLAERVTATLAGVAGIGLAMLVIGFLATAAFDARLQVPGSFTPSRSDHLGVGARALVPFGVLALAGLALFVVVRVVFGRIAALLPRLPIVGGPTRALDARVSDTWERMRRKLGPGTAADAFFVTLVGTSLIVLARFWDLIAAFFLPESGPLACAERPVHRAFSASLTLLVASGVAAWWSLSSWARRRGGGGRGSASRWGSLAWLVALVLVTTLPWRILWDTGAERVRVGGERGYVIDETSSDLLLYLPDRGTGQTVAYERGAGPAIERLGIGGYVFEEPAVFESGIPDCLSVTNPAEAGPQRGRSP